METVRLILYDLRGRETQRSTVSAATLLDAAAEAVLLGMEQDCDFHVVEPEDALFALYWVGRIAQKCGPAEVRAILAQKGL